MDPTPSTSEDVNEDCFSLDLKSGLQSTGLLVLNDLRSVLGDIFIIGMGAGPSYYRAYESKGSNGIPLSSPVRNTTKRYPSHSLPFLWISFGTNLKVVLHTHITPQIIFSRPPF